VSRIPIPVATPRWLQPLRFPAAELPWTVRRWLLDGSSTSRLIRKASGAPPGIRLLCQRWAVPCPAERQLLAMPARRLCIIREVEIYCAGEPWMLARTVAPPTLPRRILQSMRLLSDNPIAGLLYQAPGMRRSAFEVAPLYGGEPSLSPTLHWDGPVWGRRSLFFFRGAPLLLCECFLPGFQHWLEQASR